MHCSRLLSVACLFSLALVPACNGATVTPDAGHDDAPAVTDAGSDGSVLAVDAPVTADAPVTDAPISSDAPTSTDAPAVDVVLANVPDPDACTGGVHAVIPVIPDELGHYATARLRPPSYPFVVNQITYDLLSPPGTPCDASFAHEVRLIVSSAASPPTSPSTDGTLVATGTGVAGGSDSRTLVLDLPEEVRLDEGEYLYVAVKLNGGATTAMCIGACATGTPLSDVDFWSAAAAEPYRWADMVDDYGFTYNFTIRARGHAL